MESQKPKIAMYVKRPFGEKLNASLEIVVEVYYLSVVASLPYSGVEPERINERGIVDIRYRK